MKLLKKYRPAIAVQVSRRQYDPKRKRNVYSDIRSLTVKDTDVETVFNLVKRSLEKESANG